MFCDMRVPIRLLAHVKDPCIHTVNAWMFTKILGCSILSYELNMKVHTSTSIGIPLHPGIGISFGIDIWVLVEHQ